MIEVLGLGECEAAFAEASSLLQGPLMVEVLRKTAEKVAETSREKISAFAGASLGTIRPSRSISPRYAAVYQNARKVTGNHPQFGKAQLDDMEEALDENSETIVTAANAGINKLKAITGL